MAPYPIISGEHAFRAGMVYGIAVQHGLDVTPEIDPDGNYMASLLISPGNGDPALRVVVTPPGDAD